MRAVDSSSHGIATKCVSLASLRGVPRLARYSLLARDENLKCVLELDNKICVPTAPLAVNLAYTGWLFLLEQHVSTDRGTKTLPTQLGAIGD